jgi:uncharacterized membrane protein YdjX (TVP38/TMEM64 family)
VRPLLLVVVLAALFVAGRVTGVTEGWTLASIRERVQAAGPLGFLLYLALFSGGELVHVPGLVFVGAGLLAYGRLAGFPIVLAGSLVSITVSFFVVRGIGGQALAELDRPFLKKMLGRLEARPVLTVALLRMVLILLPALNYALALSPIRYRSYLLGSAIGLMPPLLVATLLFDLIFG